MVGGLRAKPSQDLRDHPRLVPWCCGVPAHLQELEALKKKLQEMEAEAAQLKEMQVRPRHAGGVMRPPRSPASTHGRPRMAARL